MHNEDLFEKFIEKMDAVVDNKEEVDIGISTSSGNEFQILMSPTDYDIFSDHGMDIYGNGDQVVSISSPKKMEYDMFDDAFLFYFNEDKELISISFYVPKDTDGTWEN